MSQDYLILIAIGPIQEFIAAARKTKDLFAGSDLLSEASKHCAAFLKNRGAGLIFPHAAEGIVANKILAEWKRSEHPQHLASACKKDLNDWIVARFNALKLRDQIDLAFDVDLDSAAEQLKHLFEFYAAWIETSSDYGQDRETLEDILAARKNLRNFEPHTGSNRPKSSLDGNRESVIVLKERPEPRTFQIKPGELLDGLGLLKRFWPVEFRFDSTHDVAARPFIAGLAPGLEGKYLQALPRGIPRSFSHIYHDDKDLSKLVAPAVRIIKAIRNPQPAYYGIFVGDGDNMGNAIGKLASPPEHRDFSRKLSGFAGAAKSAIRQQDAEPVYTGGDDVVAFLPLHTALESMWAVRGAFEQAMGSYAGVTFSAGLAVCHALDPLTESRNSAEAAEKTAKRITGKDAFCITVVPRSGAEASFKGKWDQSFHLLEKVVVLYLTKELTLGLAHDFRKLLSEWTAASGLDQHLNKMAIAIARKKQSKEPAIQLIDDFFRLPEKPRENLENLTNCLYVARPFARAKREAIQK